MNCVLSLCDGVGLVLGEDLQGIDLDDCRELGTEKLSPLAQEILARVNAYAEVSPSGTGIKLFGRFGFARSHVKPGLELYAAGRYFAVTGQSLPGHTDLVGEPQDLSWLIAREFGASAVSSRTASQEERSFEAYRAPLEGWPLERVTEELLPHLDPGCGYFEWISIGSAMHHQGQGDPAWLEAWDDWSSSSSKWAAGVCARKWKTFSVQRGNGVVTLASLIKQTAASRGGNASPQKKGPSGRGTNQADRLVEATLQAAELFHARDGTGYADVVVENHRQTWPIRSRGFRRWLARRFFEGTQSAPSSEALQSALAVIEAKAHFDAPERIVHIRVGGLADKLYLDLADAAWRAVEVDATGWRVIDNPPVRFRRAAGMLPLPAPEKGGSVEMLRPFLNVKNDSDFVLVVAWAAAALRNRGPYPVIVLSGEQGSAKSTFSSILRALLDPNTAPLRSLPREDRDLFIAANNGHLLAFDNVSGLPTWISDTLCRLATGGGFGVRALYSDGEEALFDAQRPCLLNGIEDVVARPDLADRALFLTLEPIPEERRRPEAELWAAFEAERPRILGALLDAVSEGLKRLPHTHLERLPRLADFALWASACETAAWPSGTFWAAYCGNRDEAVEGVIDADPVAATVRQLMATEPVWSGTASDLLGVLCELAGERVAKSKTWPDSPRALSGRLRRGATFLRKLGIGIAFGREGRSRGRVITIRSAEAADGGPERRTVGPCANGPIVHKKPIKNSGWDDADGVDAKIPPFAGAQSNTPAWSAQL